MTKEAKSVAKSQGQAPVKSKAQYVSPFDEMERMMEQFFDRGSWANPFQFYRPTWSELKPPFEGRTPKVDIINRDKELLVKAELPGVKKDDLDVSITKDSVTIKATCKQEEEKEEGEYHRRELSSGEFLRTLPLPTEVDGAKAKASFKDGLLELTLPKVEAAKRHTVKVE